MKLDIVLKNVGSTVTKSRDHNSFYVKNKCCNMECDTFWGIAFSISQHSL